MEEMFCRRLKPEIKFALPSLSKAENALCSHQQRLKRADIRPENCDILYTDQATNILYIQATKPDGEVDHNQIIYIRIIVHEIILHMCVNHFGI